jgi:hypothetical protein
MVRRQRKAIADIPLFEQIAEESRALLNDVAGSPDRSAGVLAAAVLDDMLGMILETHGERGEGLRFHARIERCSQKGLISPEEQRDLHVIREVRNTFAHCRHPVSFEDAGIKEKCRGLGLAQAFWAKSDGQPLDSKVWFLSGWLLLANSLALKLRDAAGGATMGSEPGAGTPIVFGGGSAPP